MIKLLKNKEVRKTLILQIIVALASVIISNFIDERAGVVALIFSTLFISIISQPIPIIIKLPQSLLRNASSLIREPSPKQVVLILKGNLLLHQYPYLKLCCCYF